jgi:protein phosphatase 1G
MTHAPPPPAPPAPPAPTPPAASANPSPSSPSSSTPATTHGSYFGMCLRQGRRSTMEDFAQARWLRCGRTGQEFGYFAVFDGHGGAHAASFVARELIGAVTQHEAFPADLPAALVSAFEETDARYLEEGARRAAQAAVEAAAAAERKKQPPPLPLPPLPQQQQAAPKQPAFPLGWAGFGGGGANSGFGGGIGANSGGLVNGGQITAASAPPGEDGSTAVVAVLLSDGTLAVANCGDSRCVLMRGGRAHTLSTDHKPNVRGERLRIERAGGAVIWSGVWRVGVGSTATGGGGGGGLLATSRAFGDRPLKLGAGVVATPDVKVLRLGEGDDVLVLASDGLFDVMNAQEALMIAREEQCASAGARRLAHEAVERGSLDNVAVLVVRLAFGGSGGGGGAEAGAGAAAGGAGARAGELKN